jgi:hypothetical protein
MPGRQPRRRWRSPRRCCIGGGRAAAGFVSCGCVDFDLGLPRSVLGTGSPAPSVSVNGCPEVSAWNFFMLRGCTWRGPLASAAGWPGWLLGGSPLLFAMVVWAVGQEVAGAAMRTSGRQPRMEGVARRTVAGGAVVCCVLQGGGSELHGGLVIFNLTDRLLLLGYGELRAKELHRPRPMSVRSAP